MIRQVLIGAMLVSFLTGCMGHNGLTRKALKWNLTTAEGEWTREFLFLGMWVIPAYPVCALVDGLFLNTIEFWSGTNPINGNKAIVDIPRSEVDKLGLGAVEVAQIERLSETQASLYLQLENGDRVTLDVVRDQETYTISYLGVEFFQGHLKL